MILSFFFCLSFSFSLSRGIQLSANDEARRRRGQIRVKRSSPTGGGYRPQSRSPRSTKGEKSFEGMTEISEDDCTLRNACTCPCASERCLMRADRPAGEMQAGPNSAGVPLSGKLGPGKRTEADARVLSSTRIHLGFL